MSETPQELMWSPSPEIIAQAHATRFMSRCNLNHECQISTFHELYAWSVANPELFWQEVWNYTGIISSVNSNSVLKHPHKMPGAQFFPDAKLNFAENLLRFTDDKTAIIFWGEQEIRRELSYADLHLEVARVAHRLRTLGVKPGDRVAGFLPNMPEAIIAMLGTTSIGAVWTSSSPDFGVSGVVDRFGQVRPKVLFTADGYFYKGKTFNSLEKVAGILESIDSIEQTVVVPYTSKELNLSALPHATSYDDFTSNDATEIDYEQVPFNHPAYVMYSSGTTGAPKCIVHGVGGTLIEHLKELVLHTDLKRADNIFYATTCGWMMWNWLTSSLATGATLLLYDGAPFHNDGSILFDLADAEDMTVFGTSAGFLSALAKAGKKPKESHNLSSLRMMLSTGSPLMPENFDYVYSKIKE